MIVGLLLAATAVFLMAQNRDLIIEESLDDEISRTIRDLATGEKKFLAIRGAYSMYFGPETALIAIDGAFDPEQRAGDLMESVDRIQKAIQQRYPPVRVYLCQSRECARAGESFRFVTREGAASALRGLSLFLIFFRRRPV